MANLKLQGLFNQKRTVSVMVVELNEADLLKNTAVATLPAESLIVSTEVITKVASGTAGSRIVIDANGTDYFATPLTTENVVTRTTSLYLPTGGDITIGPATGDEPATGSTEVIVVIHYVELDRTTGQYTD